MLRAVAIDDEPMALAVIRKFASHVSFVQLIDTFTNAFDALAFLKQTDVDVIFLDIRMPDISGLDLLKSLGDAPMVIFTTAHSEHAVQSFELNALDYLLKPFSAERFEQACAKALNMHQLRQQGISKPLHFFIRSGYESIQIIFDDILYAESIGNYVQFFVRDRRIISRLTMSETEKLLSPSEFVRIHRRFIVSRKRVTLVEKKTVSIGNVRLPVGETYWADTKKQFSR